jgi:hypothetical protein
MFASRINVGRFDSVGVIPDVIFTPRVNVSQCGRRPHLIRCKSAFDLLDDLFALEFRQTTTPAQASVADQDVRRA